MVNGHAGFGGEGFFADGPIGNATENEIDFRRWMSMQGILAAWIQIQYAQDDILLWYAAEPIGAATADQCFPVHRLPQWVWIGVGDLPFGLVNPT